MFVRAFFDDTADGVFYAAHHNEGIGVDAVHF
jgi:hypothetical protein